MRKPLAALLCAVLLESAGFAQVALSYVASFTHPVFAGNGTIGICTDSATGDIWVVDFSNTINLHRFDTSGNLLSSHPTNVCTPSMTSPNDLTQNRQDGTLWLVDNDSPGKVLQFSTSGTCIGGYTLGSAYSNPVSIAYNSLTADLKIGHTGSIASWSTTGTNLGINFTPGTYGGIVSALTHIPAIDHYLYATGSTTLTEIDGTGAFVANHVLTPAPVGIQGADYDPTTGRVVVADNSTVTIYIYQDMNFGSQYQTNQARASLLVNGAIGSGLIPANVTLGLGQPGTIAFASTLTGASWEVLLGVAPLVSAGSGGLISSDSQILNIDLTDPFLLLVNNFFQSPPFANFSVPFSFANPVSFSLQFAVLDAQATSGLRLSQPVRVQVL